MEKHSIAKMIGSPPGYIGHDEGGQLTERVKRKPYSVILLDEIEKAHPDILNILLQVFEDGQITDAYGTVVDFKNTIVILTSNIGSHKMDKGGKMGFQKDAAQMGRARRELVMDEVKRILSPEFINRLDEIIIFDPLNEEQLRSIACLMIERLNENLKERGISVQVDEAVYQWLVDTTCKDRSYGARPLRRAIQKNIEDALSEGMIRGEISRRGNICIGVENGQIKFRETTEANSAR